MHEEVVSRSQPRRRELCPKQSISIISQCSTDTTMVSHMYTLTLVDPSVHAATLIKSAQSHFHMQELNLSLDLSRKLEMHKHTFGNLKHVHVGWSCCWYAPVTTLSILKQNHTFPYRHGHPRMQRPKRLVFESNMCL